jgi:hypothetical protein
MAGKEIGFALQDRHVRIRLTTDDIQRLIRQGAAGLLQKKGF